MARTDKPVSAYAFKKAFNYAINNGVAPVDLLIDVDIIGALVGYDNMWTTEQVWKRFINNVSKHLNKDLHMLGRDVNVTKEFDNFQLGLLRVLPIRIIAKFLKRHLRDAIHKGLWASIKEFSAEKRRLVIHQGADNHDTYGPEFCAYNRGSFIGVLYSKGYRGIQMHEPECIIRGGKKCIYSVTWDSHETVPYFKLISDFVKVFLKKKDRIPDYVWRAIPHQGKPIVADDLKNLFEEDE